MTPASQQWEEIKQVSSKPNGSSKKYKLSKNKKKPFGLRESKKYPEFVSGEGKVKRKSPIITWIHIITQYTHNCLADLTEWDDFHFSGKGGVRDLEERKQLAGKPAKVPGTSEGWEGSHWRCRQADHHVWDFRLSKTTSLTVVFVLHALWPLTNQLYRQGDSRSRI